MGSISRVKSLDHLVLTVKDLDATVKFYENILGMKHTSFQSGTPSVLRHALCKSELFRPTGDPISLVVQERVVTSVVCSVECQCLQKSANSGLL